MIKFSDRSHDNFIGIEAEGVVTLDELKQAEQHIEELIAKYGKVSWMFVWKGVKYDRLGSFYEDSMWLMKHVKKFERMAIVGDSWWKKLLVEADGLIFNEKYFDLSQVEEAWAYVEGK